MRISLKQYEVNKSIVQNWYKDKGNSRPEDAVATMAIATMVPCIVVAYWIGEVTGYPEHIVTTIKNLTKFYGYTEIVDLPEGAPNPFEKSSV